MYLELKPTLSFPVRKLNL